MRKETVCIEVWPQSFIRLFRPYSSFTSKKLEGGDWHQNGGEGSNFLLHHQTWPLYSIISDSAPYQPNHHQTCGGLHIKLNSVEDWMSRNMKSYLELWDLTMMSDYVMRHVIPPFAKGGQWCHWTNKTTHLKNGHGTKTDSWQTTSQHFYLHTLWTLVRLLAWVLWLGKMVRVRVQLGLGVRVTT